jgi:phosphomannomutase
VRHLGAAAGVMVTASHNPAQDNGYKVYDRSGAQIVPPSDHEISAVIDAVGRVLDLPLGPVPAPAGPEVVRAYLDAALASSTSSARGVRVAVTALHGVGGALLGRLLGEAGFDDVHAVADQAVPDPDFPTVAFPNPEEPGALDHLLVLAGSVGADVAIANDPDADRMSAAVPDPSAPGGWRALLGDEVGAVLAWWVLQRTRGDDRLVATTIVSSSLLARQAEAAGVAHVETLTGFKWLARSPGPGQRLVYAYEEALGHCVGTGPGGPAVLDKDGLTAALAWCELVAALRAEGRTPLDVLAELDDRFGAHATAQVSVRTPDRDGALRRFAATPPSSLGGLAVAEVVDLAGGWHGLPPTEGIRLGLADARGRVVVRPSGTEPKLKAYAEVIAPRRAEAQALLAAVVDDLRALVAS